MSYTDTTFLGVKKADVGSNQAFETSVFNDNWDLIDAGVEANAVAVESLGDYNVTQDTAINAATLTANNAAGAIEVIQANGWVTSARIGNGQVTSAKIDTVAGSKVTGTVPDATKWAGRAVFVGSSTPTGMATGDIWFKTA